MQLTREKEYRISLGFVSMTSHEFRTLLLLFFESILYRNMRPQSNKKSAINTLNKKKRDRYTGFDIK